MAFRLAELPQLLRKEGVKVKYRRLYELARSDELPGAHQVRGRWQIDAPIKEVVAAVRAA